MAKTSVSPIVGKREIINMNKILFSTVIAVLFGLVTISSAATISSGSDFHNIGVGEYNFVSGNDMASSPGQVLEVLGGTLKGDAKLRKDGNESGTNSIDMSFLYNTLASGGVTWATKLAFGFGLNETGSIGSNSITIDSLNMTFNRQSEPAKTFSLLNNSITILNYEQGQNMAEALISVDLGYDFMQEYDGSSTEQFMISSDISNTSDGFEIYFLSSNFTIVSNPEPVSSMLFIVGGATLVLRRFWKKRRNV